MFFSGCLLNSRRFVVRVKELGRTNPELDLNVITGSNIHSLNQTSNDHVLCLTSGLVEYSGPAVLMLLVYPAAQNPLNVSGFWLTMRLAEFRFCALATC